MKIFFADRYFPILWLGVALLVAADAHAKGVRLATRDARPNDPSRFAIFDGTMYRNKPDLSSHGIRRIHIIYSRRFWKDGARTRELPAEETVRQLARDAARRGDIAVIDIEHWLLHRDEAEVEENIGKYQTIARWFRAEAPNLQIGYFGMFPLPDYDRGRMALGYVRYKAWQRDNDRIRPLADAVDAIFPEAYASRPDPEEWVKYATALVREARRYGKPVYLFLWPQYSEKNKQLGHQYLSADFWQLQLDTARRHADGAVIWGGWDSKRNHVAEWDDQAPWWQATKRFMQRLEQPPGLAPQGS